MFALGWASLRAETFDVFILAGQSNMDARAHRSDLPAALQQPQSDVRFFYQDGWTDLAPGSSARPAPPDGFGPEISFGRSLADRWPRAGKIAIIKHAKGGTSLAEDWRIDGGDQLAQLLAKVEAALGVLRREGHDVRLQAFVWMQGERDATSGEQAAPYEARLRRFIRHVRLSLREPELPFVIGRIKAPEKPFRDTVRRAQEQVAGSIPGVLLVNTDDLGLLDVVHYDAAGQVELGRRFAAAARRLSAAALRPSSANPPPGRSE